MNSLITITPYRWSLLVKGHGSLDEVMLLQCLRQGMTPSAWKEKKIQALVQGLKRKGLLSEEGSLTTLGEEWYAALTLPDEAVLPTAVIEKADEAFSQWFAAFPVNSQFTYKGISFPNTRRLKKYETGKQKALFYAILSSREFTTDELIRALIAEVYSRMEQSLVTRRNDLHYMRNSETYLFQQDYRAFMDNGRELTEGQIADYYLILKGRSASAPTSYSVDL